MNLKVTNSRRIRCHHLRIIDHVEYPVDEKASVVKISVNVYIKEDDVEQKKDNIFHTRSHINNKVCSLIIDNKSCVNVSNTLVKK